MRKESIITIFAANYVETILPDFLENCFDSYSKKDFTKRHFQMSVHENTYATAGMILTALAIEAYRNRIYYLEKKKITRHVENDLSAIFSQKDSSFPLQEFKDILAEIFVLRDIIAHNHVYKVDIQFDDEWDMIGHKQRLPRGYGDRNFVRYTNSRTKKTNHLGLNIQPGKIGFEDLLLILIIFDLYIGIIEKLLGRGYAPFNFWRDFEGGKTEHFYLYLTYFYSKIPSATYLKRLDRILSSLKTTFGGFVSDHLDYFITNTCIKCGAFGYKKIGRVYRCDRCGHAITFIA